MIEISRLETAINRNMRCIEIPVLFLHRADPLWINRNMRCIEMPWRIGLYRWIWQINRNMRCIVASIARRAINRNMRCIEIRIPNLSPEFLPGLIETWDVLKFYIRISQFLHILINRNMRCIEIFRILLWLAIQTWLIETWDVLKWFHSQWWMMDCID